MNEWMWCVLQVLKTVVLTIVQQRWLRRRQPGRAAVGDSMTPSKQHYYHRVKPPPHYLLLCQDGDWIE